jgi:hypothetical protein
MEAREKKWSKIKKIAVVKYAVPCVMIADFRETTNVGTYKCLILAESLNSCSYKCTVQFTIAITAEKWPAIV